MEFTRQDSPFKKRKNSAEMRNIRNISQTLNDALFANKFLK